MPWTVRIWLSHPLHLPHHLQLRFTTRFPNGLCSRQAPNSPPEARHLPSILDMSPSPVHVTLLIPNHLMSMATSYRFTITKSTVINLNTLDQLSRSSEHIFVSIQFLAAQSAHLASGTISGYLVPPWSWYARIMTLNSSGNDIGSERFKRLTNAFYGSCIEFIMEGVLFS